MEKAKEEAGSQNRPQTYSIKEENNNYVWKEPPGVSPEQPTICLPRTRPNMVSTTYVHNTLQGIQMFGFLS
jgi:hypothetical protein